MRGSLRSQSLEATGPGARLQLGLVILPCTGCLTEAEAELRAHPGLELGAAEGHRLPAVADVPVGQDEAWLRTVEALPTVLRVDVVFAQIVEESLS